MASLRNCLFYRIVFKKIFNDSDNFYSNNHTFFYSKYEVFWLREMTFLLNFDYVKERARERQRDFDRSCVYAISFLSLYQYIQGNSVIIFATYV